MSKLKEMTSEQVSLAEKFKIGVRRVRLASIGLISVADTETNRLYRQISEMGKPIGSAQTLFGRISQFSTGAINFFWEETQKIFDELVEEGETAVSKGRLKSLWKPEKPDVSKLTNAKKKPVLKEVKTAKVEDQKSTKPASTVNQAKKVKPKSSARSKAISEPLPESLKHQFYEARQTLSGIDALSDSEQMELRALEKQALEGDVKGRRPAQSKPEACAEYDARKSIKGMKASDAAAKYISLVGRKAPAPVM